MLNDLAAQDGDSALKRRLARYARPQRPVIDEVGYLSYSNRHADLLFEIVSRRYEEKSAGGSFRHGYGCRCSGSGRRTGSMSSSGAYR